MKNKFILFIVLICLFYLVGCTNIEDTNESTETEGLNERILEQEKNQDNDEKLFVKNDKEVITEEKIDKMKTPHVIQKRLTKDNLNYNNVFGLGDTFFACNWNENVDYNCKFTNPETNKTIDYNMEGEIYEVTDDLRDRHTLFSDNEYILDFHVSKTCKVNSCWFKLKITDKENNIKHVQYFTRFGSSIIPTFYDYDVDDENYPKDRKISGSTPGYIGIKKILDFKYPYIYIEGFEFNPYYSISGQAYPKDGIFSYNFETKELEYLVDIEDNMVKFHSLYENRAINRYYFVEDYLVHPMYVYNLKKHTSTKIEMRRETERYISCRSANPYLPFVTFMKNNELHLIKGNKLYEYDTKKDEDVFVKEIKIINGLFNNPIEDKELISSQFTYDSQESRIVYLDQAKCAVADNIPDHNDEYIYINIIDLDSDYTIKSIPINSRSFNYDYSTGYIYVVANDYKSNYKQNSNPTDIFIYQVEE